MISESIYLIDFSWLKSLVNSLLFHAKKREFQTGSRSFFLQHSLRLGNTGVSSRLQDDRPDPSW